MLEHPEIGWIERTGYPSWAQPKLPCKRATDRRSALSESLAQESEVRGDEDDEDCFDEDGYDRDAYEAYCDYLYEERRERELFGE